MIYRFKNRRSGTVWLVECDATGQPLEDLQGRIHVCRESQYAIDMSRDYARGEFEERFARVD